MSSRGPLATRAQIGQLKKLFEFLKADTVDDRRRLVTTAVGSCPPFLTGPNGLNRTEAAKIIHHYSPRKTKQP